MKSKIIAIQEELLQNAEWERFLKTSLVKVVVLSKRTASYEALRELENKFKSYSNFHSINFVPSGHYSKKYDVYVFAPQNYEEAKSFSILNPQGLVVVFSTPALELNFESEDNFMVRTWQYIETYINNLRETKPKVKK
jgi:hypothetical protein